MATHRSDAGFRAFFESESLTLQRFATFMCGDPDTAADLTQEAFTLVYKRWRWLRKAEAPAYVRRTIVNLVRDRQRRELIDVRRRAAGTMPVSEPSRAGQVDDWILVTRALRQLSPARRATVVLRFYEDMTEHQIAAVLGRPLGTVKSDLHRALRDLRQLIEPHSLVVKESK